MVQQTTRSILQIRKLAHTCYNAKYKPDKKERLREPRSASWVLLLTFGFCQPLEQPKVKPHFPWLFAGLIKVDETTGCEKSEVQVSAELIPSPKKVIKKLEKHQASRLMMRGC